MTPVMWREGMSIFLLSQSPLDRWMKMTTLSLNHWPVGFLLKTATPGILGIFYPIPTCLSMAPQVPGNLLTYRWPTNALTVRPPNLSHNRVKVLSRLERAADQQGIVGSCKVANDSPFSACQFLTRYPGNSTDPQELLLARSPHFLVVRSVRVFECVCLCVCVCV